MPKNRWQAFFIHLGISSILYVILLYHIVYIWYPQPFFSAEGGWRGVQLITGVDLILGPLLTLIVYVPGKPGLKLDLTLIALLQSIALGWGTWLVYDQRLAIVAFADDSFHAMSHELVQDAGGKAVTLLTQSTTHPPYAFVHLPDGPKERQALRMKSLFNGVTLHRLGDRYEPLTKEYLGEVLAAAVDIGQYTKTSEFDQDTLDRFLSRHGGTIEDYAFVPLHCRYDFLMLALRRQDGVVVDSVSIRPRKFVKAATSPPK